MRTFSLSYKLKKAEDQAKMVGLMEAWEGLKVMDSVWILKRNDGCTCRDIIDDFLEHIAAENEISVVEIGRKDGIQRTETHPQVC